ncbi:MAG: DUF805 domain-containing protein [Rickettsiaceae bacterium]|nr:DUF805 domain-containing protein [Rickettsiaceae bacterium]
MSYFKNSCFYKLLIKNAFNFKDRASRSDFGWVLLHNIGIFLLISTALLIFPFTLILLPLYIFLYLVYIGVMIRRLHDNNHSGWLLLLNFIPIISIIFVLHLFFSSGDEGDNHFGSPSDIRKANKLDWGILLISIALFFCILPLSKIILT